jgi:hypothetical protein
MAYLSPDIGCISLQAALVAPPRAELFMTRIDLPDLFCRLHRRRYG